jgi:MraZ protein
MREYAGLEKDIVLAGMLKNIEIWSRSRFDAEMTRAEENLEEVGRHLADLGL